MYRASGIVVLVFLFCVSALAHGLQDSLQAVGGDALTQEWQIPASTTEPALPVPSLYEDNLKAGRKVDFMPGVAEALANLGKYFMEQEDYDSAHKYYLSFQKLGEQMHDSLFLCEASSKLAMVYRRQGLWDKSEEEYSRAVEIAIRKNNKPMLGKLYNQLGSLMYAQQKYARANSYFINSLHNISGNSKVEYAAILHNIGVVHKAKKNYPKSLEYLNQALAILEKINYKGDISAVLLNIGEIHKASNEYDLAEQYYQRALKEALKMRMMEKIVASYQHLSELNAAKDQYKLAYQYSNLYIIYKDSLSGLEKLASQNVLKKKQEIDRRKKVVAQLIQEKELDILSKEYQISKLAIAQKNGLIWYACLTSFLLSMLAVVLYQSYKLKKKRNLELEKAHFQACSHNFLLQDLNAKLKQSEQQLKELNETKDKFFSIISHDLRGPLNTLSGFVGLMKKSISYFSAEELNDFSTQMERSLQGVTALLDNLFQWASSQTGLIKFSPQEFQLRKVVEENVNLLKGTADMKEIELSFQLADDLYLNADIQMMRLLLRNLVSNAIKFTPRGGFVKVNAWVENRDVILTIEDNGTGISEENQRKLLKSSTVFSQQGTEKEKGSGLGLVLCKEFVEKHKGNISIKSTLNEGTTFIIRLPDKIMKETPAGSLS